MNKKQLGAIALLLAGIAWASAGGIIIIDQFTVATLMFAFAILIWVVARKSEDEE